MSLSRSADDDLTYLKTFSEEDKLKCSQCSAAEVLVKAAWWHYILSFKHRIRVTNLEECLWSSIIGNNFVFRHLFHFVIHRLFRFLLSAISESRSSYASFRFSAVLAWDRSCLVSVALASSRRVLPRRSLARSVSIDLYWLHLDAYLFSCFESKYDIFIGLLYVVNRVYDRVRERLKYTSII